VHCAVSQHLWPRRQEGTLQYLLVTLHVSYLHSLACYVCITAISMYTILWKHLLCFTVVGVLLITQSYLAMLFTVTHQLWRWRPSSDQEELESQRGLQLFTMGLVKRLALGNNHYCYKLLLLMICTSFTKQCLDMLEEHFTVNSS
jgi:hypothetical protein